MFTGLIEDVGRLRRLERGDAQCRMTVTTRLPVEELGLGDSVAVNGACLTVVHTGQDDFTVDVSPETLARTILGDLKPGDPVNLERALRLGDRFGGHIVTGHVDAVATLRTRQRQGNAEVLDFALEQQSLRYLVDKGSVAIDGISLTVNKVFTWGFSVAIIPHTMEKTTLAGMKPGCRVNIETDILGKYIERLIQGGSEHRGGLSFEDLARSGFLS
ncbi:MAG: riboflavin synthase [Deltaproteobacteria bacterium]|nr:MAG: riboflavin synthase [Deltaproteobacteria bacterium]